MELFKEHGGGKNLGWEEQIFFKCFAFPRKTFAFSLKDICILSQNQLNSDKLFLFTLQLAVVHTAPYVHNGAVHRVLF